MTADSSASQLAELPSERQNYIDGEWVDAESGETFKTTNPASPDETVASYPQSDESDAERAIEAAVAVQPDWAATPAPERGRVLIEASNRLAERKSEITDLLVSEEGKTQAEAGGEVQRAIDIFAYYGSRARDRTGTVKASSSENTTLYTVDQPVGVAGLITPWNYPIAIPAWKIAPALATGNAAVLKPATLAPGPAVEIARALDDAGLPAGVFNVVTGPGSSVGATFTEHEGIDAVSFTGSSAVGEQVYQDAASLGKRVQTELGGKNPTVVSASADIDQAADIVSMGAFGVTGQACTACSRAIVHTDVYGEFVEAVVDRASAIDVGPGDEYDMGPQVSESELEGTLEYIETAQEQGNELAHGGEQLSGDRYGDGYFVQPTVFVDVAPDDTLACDEVFGPVLAVIEAQDFDDAVEIANDVEYGLSASVVTENYTEAKRFVDEIEAGVAKVNEKTTGLELHVPFGGFKRSSSETWREQGDAGMDFFTISKTVYENY